MRDLLAPRQGIPEAWLRPPKKKRRWKRSALLVLSGGVIGFLPLAWMLWHGRNLHLLTFEHASSVAWGGTTVENARMSAWFRLVTLGKQALVAIRGLEKRGGEFQVRASTALARLDSLMIRRRLPRTGPRPTSITYREALHELISPQANRARTWTSLEVVVYGLEDVILGLRRNALKGGELGDFAKICLSKLRGFPKTADGAVAYRTIEGASTLVSRGPGPAMRDPDRFQGSPRSGRAGDSVEVTFTNPDLANQKVIITVRNGLGAEREISITLDKNGKGKKEVELPTGWEGAVLQHPTSADHVILIID